LARIIEVSVYIYIYIYIYRERERETTLQGKLKSMLGYYINNAIFQVINAHYSQFCIPCLRVHLNTNTSSSTLPQTTTICAITATPRKKSSNGFAVTPSKASRTSPSRSQAKTPKKG
ncbi:unnamed protein product, partial [Meganyctiphanes norvegica]